MTTPRRRYYQFIRAFEIFAKYPGSDNVMPGDDVLYAGPDPDSVTEEDKAELGTLGWFATKNECFIKFV